MRHVCACGRETPAPTPIAIQPGVPGKIEDLILWNCCGCGSTNSIKWTKATDRQRHDALLARNAVWAASGWI